MLTVFHYFEIDIESPLQPFDKRIEHAVALSFYLYGLAGKVEHGREGFAALVFLNTKIF